MCIESVFFNLFAGVSPSLFLKMSAFLLMTGDMLSCRNSARTEVVLVHQHFPFSALALSIRAAKRDLRN